MSKPLNPAFAALSPAGFPRAPRREPRHPQDQLMGLQEAKTAVSYAISGAVKRLEGLIGTAPEEGSPEASAAVLKLDDLNHGDNGSELLHGGQRVNSLDKLNALVAGTQRLYGVYRHHTGEHLFVFEVPTGATAYAEEVPISEVIKTPSLLPLIGATRTEPLVIETGRTKKTITMYGFQLDWEKHKVARPQVNVFTVRLSEDYSEITGWNTGVYTAGFSHTRRSQLVHIPAPKKLVVTQGQAPTTTPATQPAVS